MIIAAVVVIKFARQIDNFFAMPTFGFFSSGRQAYQAFAILAILVGCLVMVGVFDLASNDVKDQSDTSESQERKGIILPN